ncbi:MAG: amidohydrolase [Synergistaceae bacterium]|jgi:amidohydrolase|nr:amidohydrolase [Synergistaceae bacterium]
MYERIGELARQLQPELVEWRRELHRRPELAWREVFTTDRIVSLLERWGYSIVQRGFNGTQSGVVADLAGRGEGGKTVALRADIDALALTEETGAPYASETEGVSHACGHDAHAAMLLGAAKILSECRDGFEGRVRLLFQPAEEGGVPSGAQSLIAEGALEGVDAIFGMHIQATLPSGVFSYGFGPRMTASGKWTVTIRGKGSHGAFPEWSKDPIVAASNFVMNLQALISRELRPLDAAVVSVGIFKPSSETFNSIPDRVELQGTTRSYRPEVQSHLEEGLRRLAECCAATHRCEAEFSFRSGLPALVNDLAVTTVARDAARALRGDGALLEEAPQMGSEDFSYYLEKTPGSYCFLGCGGEGTPSPYAHHSPKFRIDESVLWMGSAWHAAVATDLLSEGT